jgi:hypothetical protein
MFILLVLLSLIRASFSISATCYGDVGLIPWVEYAYDLQESVCGNGACNVQFGDDSNTDFCDIRMIIGGKWQVEWLMNDTTGKYSSWSVIFLNSFSFKIFS